MIAGVYLRDVETHSVAYRRTLLATPRVDFTGRAYGRLKVVGFAEYRPSTGRCRRAFWRCLCSCGVECIVGSGNLKKGKAQSCGCRNREIVSARMTTHGMSNSPEYSVWSAVIQRCTNKKAPGYKYYGGRGVTVCDRWRKSFEMFRADMGARPSLAHTIDRIDNDGDYTPGNCRWATSHVQHRNRSDSIMITHDGETRCAADWAKIVGLHRDVIRSRLQRGWSDADALTVPSGARTANAKPIEFRGRTMLMVEWAREIGVSPATLSQRLKHGWPVDRALTTPPDRSRLPRHKRKQR